MELSRDRLLQGVTTDCHACQTNLTLVLAITIPSVLLFLALLSTISVMDRRNARLDARLNKLAKKYEIEESPLHPAGPRNFMYRDLSTATKGFSSERLVGVGGLGSVYRGTLLLMGADKPKEIAVKRISTVLDQEAREFLTDVKIIGQLQHRNLVRLLGWCHEKGEMLLVYDYMPNGSVDQHLFKNVSSGENEPVLTWARRLKIVSGVATALAYLHEDKEQRVIHRDVKSSNVMLDRDFNARLGDFGLARLSEHDQNRSPSTVALAGTYGYLAPEMIHTLKATEKTDVYSFGTMVLEVGTGKRPILCVEDRRTCNESLLVHWVSSLHRDDGLLKAADRRLQNAFDPGEMIMFLKIGLLCSDPDPDKRPTMREVLNIWKGTSPFPPLPHSNPARVFASDVESFETVVTILKDDSEYSVESEAFSFALQSDGDSTLMTSSKNNHGDSIPPPQRDQRQTGGPQMPILRYRPSSTTTSLPL